MFKKVLKLIRHEQEKTYQDVVKLAEREILLRQLIEIIGSSLDINEVKKLFVEEVGKAFKADKCRFRVYDNDKEEFITHDPKLDYVTSEDLRIIYEFGKEIDNFIVEEYRRAGAIIVPDYSVYMDDKGALGFAARTQLQYNNIKSNYCFGLFDGDRFMGSFIVQYKEVTHLNNDDINLLKSIVSQASIALKQAELYSQAQQASRAKSEFLASMSYEFRTPLNAIIGFTDMIRSGMYGALPDKISRHLDIVSKSSKHLLNLINDILDISKVEADKIELNYENIHTKLLIYEIVTGIEPLASQKNIQIKQHLQDINIKADSKRFIQILNNLLSNAVKFTENGGKVIICTELRKNNLIVTVEDTGIGIAKKHYDKIFKHFSQVGSSAGRQNEGTGLGLVLTKKLVELHGGTIFFESEEGKGTKFTFELPVNPERADKKTALIIEDKELTVNL